MPTQSNPRPRPLSWSSWLAVAAVLAAVGAVFVPAPVNGLTFLAVVLALAAIATRAVRR